MTITSPVAVAGPNDDGVLVARTVDVVCTAERSPVPGATAVDPSSVVVELIDGSGQIVPADPTSGVLAFPTKGTGKANEYVAHLTLTNVADNGRIRFTCLASDTSDPPLTGSDTVKTFIDHGPAITVEEPTPDSPHSLLGALDVAFRVDEAPVGSGDKGAKVDKVSLSVAGVDFTDALEEDNGEYTTSVDLTDMSLFATTPVGDVPITIHATDQRDPSAERVESYSVKVDSEGPVIAVVSPTGLRAPVVGGRVPLVFTVVDDVSGVDQSSVRVTFVGNAEYYYGEGGEWSVEGNQYTFKFDSTQIDNSQAQININIHAKDLAGNDSLGASQLVYLDNVAPIVDLDPGNVRTWKQSGSTYTCSESFDPLGSALSDEDPTKSRFALVRSLVWERANHEPGQHFDSFSGVVDSTVQLFIQPDTSQPFLINSPNDADPDCDDIDPAARKTLPILGLSPLAPTGAAFYGTDDVADFPPIDAFSSGQCDLGTAADAPLTLCTNHASDLSVVIPHADVDRSPALYVVDPDDAAACTGLDFELGAYASEGWVCLAARALDAVGNIGISRPLRLCYDDPKTSFEPPCATMSEEPPDCTDGCSLPPAFPESPSDAILRE